MARGRPWLPCLQESPSVRHLAEQLKTFETTAPTAPTTRQGIIITVITPGVCQRVPVTSRPFSWTATHQGIVITVITPGYIRLRLPPTCLIFNYTSYQTSP